MTLRTDSLTTPCILGHETHPYPTALVDEGLASKAPLLLPQQSVPLHDLSVWVQPQHHPHVLQGVLLQHTPLVLASENQQRINTQEMQMCY